jgi:hypothetical protein
MSTYPKHPKRHPIRAMVAVSMLSACIGLAACGSSGSGSSSASKSTSTSKQGGPGSSQFAALRSCLQKQGITLPSVPSGARPQPGGQGAGSGGRPGGFQLPKGVSQAAYQAALKKCGGGNIARGGAGGFNSASARKALVKYAACLRENGVNVPAPNTSGKGPVFNTKGIDTSSTKFKAAQSKCQSDIKGAFAGGGANGAPPSGGAGGGEPPNGAPSGAPPSEEGGA